MSEEKPLILPFACPQEKYSDTSSNSSSSSFSAEIASEGKGKRKRDGKGSNILFLVRKLLKCPENWKSIGSKQDYQFLGTFPNPSLQQLYYIPNCSELEQSSHANLHYLWTDIQLSKGHLNKYRLIEVELVDINGQTKKEKMFYRSAPCLGVKHCAQPGCKYVAPIRERRNCPIHPDHKLVHSVLNLCTCFLRNMNRTKRRRRAIFTYTLTDI